MREKGKHSEPIFWALSFTAFQGGAKKSKNKQAPGKDIWNGYLTNVRYELAFKRIASETMYAGKERREKKKWKMYTK